METGDKARMTARLTSGLPFRSSNIPGYFMPSGSHVGERPDKQHVHLRARMMDRSPAGFAYQGDEL